jgi:hypothetical protein
MNTLRRNLFKRYSTPPDRLTEEVQRSATEQGWMSPWTLEELREKGRLQKKHAGEASGHVRAAREKVRRDLVFILYLNLDAAYRNQPFSTKSIKVLHDEYLKVLHGEKDNVLEAASNVFLDPFSMAMVQSLYENYQARQQVSPYNFLETISSVIINCRKQHGWDRDLLPTNDSFPVGTTWDELRVPFFVQTCVDFHRLSEIDLWFLSGVSPETLKKDLKSMNIRGRRWIRGSM